METTKQITLNIQYNQAQQAAIDKALEQAKDTLNGFLSYSWSERIVQRGKQQFAVFGHYAYELFGFSLIDDDKGRVEYVPVVVDGRMLHQEPDEGRSGMAYLMRSIAKNGKDTGWWVAFAPLGWLRTSELELSNQEIEQRIAEEIDSGAAHITGGKGWG